MKTLDFLVPAALIPVTAFGTDAAPELLRGLSLKYLDFIAAHAGEAAREVTTAAHPESTLLSPWQAYLFGDKANIAAAWAQALQQPASPARRWLVEPVHLQVGLDRVNLLDPAQLDLNADEALALADAARPVLEADGWQLVCADPLHWLIARADDFDLQGEAIENVIGDSIANALPTGQAAHTLAWKRTLNEIQMTWFVHAVNRQREDRGLPAINGLWLSGNGSAARLLQGYAGITSTLPLLRHQPLDSRSTVRLETFELLIAPARAQDWSRWRNGLQALDLRLAEILADMRAGQISELRLIACGEQARHEHRIQRNDFWKFWRRGQAVDLLIE